MSFDAALMCVPAFYALLRNGMVVPRGRLGYSDAAGVNQLTVEPALLPTLFSVLTPGPKCVFWGLLTGPFSVKE